MENNDDLISTDHRDGSTINSSLLRSVIEEVQGFYDKSITKLNNVIRVINRYRIFVTLIDQVLYKSEDILIYLFR